MQKISISNKEYNLRVKYSKRARHLKLQISEEGLELILPYGVSTAEGERFLSNHKEWIEKHIGKYNSLPAEYFYLGRKISIEHKQVPAEKYVRIELINPDELRITSAPGKNLKLNKLYELWLKNKAKFIIPDRVKYLADKHNFRTGKVSIRNQKTRWGSCSGRGNLSFNAKLMMFEPTVIDYVIVHELCHLKEMNHSKKFWNNVAVIIPEYKELKNKLKKNIIK